MTDQEGGATRRLVWAPPHRSAALLGRQTAAAVGAAGKATAIALRNVGVNVDLAPVADVPGGPSSFIAAQARAFSTDPNRVASLATAFAQGLADGGVAATAKHFPGLGRARVSTDVAAVTVGASLDQLDTDLIPYRRLIAAGIPLVMLSNATYTALDSKPAAWSLAVQTLLRRTLGFRGVTITDALDAVAPRTVARSRPLPFSLRRPESTFCSSRGARPKAMPSIAGSSAPPRREGFPGRGSSAAMRESSP